MGSIRFIAYSLVGLIIYSCASSNQSQPYFDEEKGYYTTAFPVRDVTSQLATIQQSVLRITSTSIYSTYYIDEKMDFTYEDLQNTDIREITNHRSTIDQSKAGTAISILQNDRHTALITAAHVLDAPDTLISFRTGPNIPENKLIHSVGVKLKQRNYVHTYNTLKELDIIAVNRVNDIALIEIENNEDESFNAAPLRIQTGAAKRLRLGSFIYVMGFPLGSAMVTRGIISAPDYDEQGNFLTDALFNHGISGGMIMASRDNFKSLEWVGMSITAAASQQYFLVPNPISAQQYKNMEIYTDTAFVAQKSIINYGVTQALPIEKILLFLYSNEDKLNRLGLSSTQISGQ